MNFKTTYILGGILLLVLVVFGVALWKDTGKKDTSGYVLPGMRDEANPLKPDDVTEIEIQRDRPEDQKQTVTLARDPQTKNWEITQPLKVRADDGAVNRLLREIYDAQRDTQADKAPSLKEWGLDPAAEVITLKKGDRQVELKVGDVSEGSTSAVIYVLSSDRPNEPMAVSKTSLESVLQTGVNDLRSRVLLAAGTSDIQAVTLSQKGKETVELKKAGEDRWQFVKPPYGDAEVQDNQAFAPDKPPSGVQPMLTDLTDLRVDYTDSKVNDFVADNVEDLAKYNLDPAKSDVLRVEVERVDQAGGAGDKADKKTSRAVLLVGVGKKAEDKADKYYATLEGSKTVVRVAAKNVEPLLKLLADPAALRDKTLVRLPTFKQPDALDIDNSYGKLAFRRPDPTNPTKWQLYYKSETGQPVSQDTIQQLINTLTQKDQVKSFPKPEERKQLGLEKPDVTLTLWVEALAPAEKKEDADKDKEKDKGKDKEKDKDKAKAKGPEKKEGKPKFKEGVKPLVTLAFGNRVSGQVAVERKREGEATGTLVMVPEGLLDLVKKAPLEYLDKELPQFSPGSIDATQSVTKLELDRDGTTYVIARKKGAEGWTFDKPADMAGRSADPNAVRDVLNTLNRLRAAKLVTEKAGPATLEKDYGLAKPALKAVVTVTKDGKDTTHEYDFGKDEDKDHVYAKQGQRDMVFTVDKHVLTTLRAELQDPTVFNFDAAKVKAVKVTGWKELLGTPLTLEVERKGPAEWNVKSPPKFNLDRGKLERFLADLSHLRSVSFVAHKATPKPEQGLDVDQGALAVEITVEGEKEPLRLTVGKADGEKGYFAISDRLKGDIFDVRKDIFDGPKSKPAYFSP
jgi:hypothetical protein